LPLPFSRGPSQNTLAPHFPATWGPKAERPRKLKAH